MHWEHHLLNPVKVGGFQVSFTWDKSVRCWSRISNVLTAWWLTGGRPHNDVRLVWGDGGFCGTTYWNLRNGYRKILGVLRYTLRYNFIQSARWTFMWRYWKKDAGLDFCSKGDFQNSSRLIVFGTLMGHVLGGFIHLKKNPTAGDFPQSLLTSRSFVLGEPMTPKKVEQTKIPVVGSCRWLLFFDSEVSVSKNWEEFLGGVVVWKGLPLISTKLSWKCWWQKPKGEGWG